MGLDLRPKVVSFKGKRAIGDDVHIFFRPVHTLYRVNLQGGNLGLAYLDDDWLEQKLSERELAVREENVEQGLLLTAGTEELQALVTELAPEIPTDELTFRRQK